MPRPVDKVQRKYGIQDVCKKNIYPPPRDCKTLAEHGEVVAEIPFQKILGLYSLLRFTGPVPGNDTPEKAWAALQALPEFSQDNPTANVFYFNFLFLLQQPIFGIWTAQSARNTQGMIMPAALILPAWLTDSDISFSVAFNSPVIAGAPAWATGECELGSFGFNAGPREFPLEKSVFLSGDYRLHFICEPMNFSYAQFLELPEYSSPLYRGWSYSNMPAFNLRLIVRRGLGNYKVCWPEEALRGAACVAVVDSVSGLVVGPPIKL